MATHMVVEESSSKDDWQAIRWRMNERRITPARLAYLTHHDHSKESILRGIGGDPVPLMPRYLRECVKVFGLVSARGGSYAGIVDSMSYEDCMRLIRPHSAMPLSDGDFWDREDSDDSLRL